MTTCTKTIMLGETESSCSCESHSIRAIPFRSLDELAEVPQPIPRMSHLAPAVEQVPIESVKMISTPATVEPEFQIWPAVRFFRDDFTKRIKTNALKRLMTKYPTKYCRVLDQCHDYFSRHNWVPLILWSLLDEAYQALPEEVQAQMGGEVRESEEVICTILAYSRYQTLLNNKGLSTSTEQVQAILAKEIITTGRDHYNPHKIDTAVIHSCLPNLSYRGLTVPECQFYLEEFWSNLSAYYPLSGAICLIKFARVLADLGQVNMILAIADGPFSDALKHVKHAFQEDIKESDDELSFRAVKMTRSQ